MRKNSVPFHRVLYLVHRVVGLPSKHLPTAPTACNKQAPRSLSWLFPPALSYSSNHKQWRNKEEESNLIPVFVLTEERIQYT